MHLPHINLPVLLAFAGSLILSAIALQFEPILGRDSALYVDIASKLVYGSLADLEGYFDWPWLPFLIAKIHANTGLSLIASGHILDSFLMAATCAFITRSTQMLNSNAAWWGCLASLSLPSFNQYRDTILREPGFWMFAALSVLAVGAWANNRSLSRTYLAIAVLSIVAATMFRLEAVFLIGALVSALTHSYLSQPEKNRSLFLSLCGIILILMVSFYLIYLLDAPTTGRVNYYFQLLNPNDIATKISADAAILAEQILKDYSHDDAELILLFGFLGVILLTIVKSLGPFILTLAIAGKEVLASSKNSTAIYAAVGIALYIVVLMVFFVQQSFMIDRYTAVIHVLAAPWIALSALRFSDRYPVTGRIVAIFAVLVALSNVISLSDKRTHYLTAAEWISRNIPEKSSTYYADGRISFYADRNYQPPLVGEKEVLNSHFEKYDYFVLELDKNSPLLEHYLHSQQLAMIAEFDNGGRHSLVIVGKPENPIR